MDMDARTVNADTSTAQKCEIPANATETAQWNDIDWDTARKFVSRLQTRISKAQLKNETNLVKRLQHLLVNSFYAKALAVRRVSQMNKGRHTAGVDGILWNTDRKRMDAVRSLNRGRYRSEPLRRIYIPKKNGKLRPLSIPTMYDRAMQALYALALDPVQEATADPNSYGFRLGRSCQDAGEQIFLMMAREYSPRWVLEGDIKGCFDNFSHQWILDNIPMDKRVLRQFLKAGYVFGERLFPTETGSPQGGVISPVIANMVLNGMEKLVRASIPNTHVVRFADDFVVICRAEGYAEQAKDLISAFLAERGLELSPEKTRITHVCEGFDFLGWNFRKYEVRKKLKMLIKPSRKSLDAIKDTVKTVVLGHGKAMTQDQLIQILNPRLRGWCNYHRSAVSSKTFGYLDAYLFRTLYIWALHRHNDKSKQWVLDRYWHRKGTRRFEFFTEDNQLFRPCDVKIRRHVKVKAHTNPYIDTEYYDGRRARHKNERGFRDKSFTS